MSALKIKFKSETFNLEIDADKSIDDVFEYLSEVIDLNKLHCRLIVGGKSFLPGATASSAMIEAVWPSASTAMLLSSPQADIDRIKSQKSDPLVKGFEEEARDEIRRIQKTVELVNASPWGSGVDQHVEFRFSRFEVLFRRTNPSPYDAEKLLKKLATDPGVVQIMSSRRFTVGTLCELDPEDADNEQAAKGEGDKCLLGWNRNFGERIALRLRTDDFKSFRKYDSIINTLIHELAHNVVGPHNDQFWALFNDLKKAYDSIHASRRGAKATGSRVAPERSVTKAELDEILGANTTSGALGGKVLAINQDELREARLKFLTAKSKK